MSPLSDHQRGYFQAHRVGTVYLTAGQAPDDAIRSTAASMLRGYELDGEPRPAVRAKCAPHVLRLGPI